MKWFIFLSLLVFCSCRSLPTSQVSSCDVNAPKQEQVEIYATDTAFDPTKGEVKYTLPQDALVRVRIGVTNGGPLLRTLVDWEKRSKGTHVESWDRKSHDGAVDFSARGDLMVMLNCIPLEHGLRMGESFGMIKSTRVSPRVNISLPESKVVSPQGWPVVSGNAAIRVILDPKDKSYMTSTKYEVGLYLDYVFLMEDEEGVDPYTYRINTANIPNGPHLLTVNVIGYNGDIGTQSTMVVIKNEE